MDRLKQQLTQMKNENELLRSQVTKAANQADEAEKKLEETLKVSFLCFIYLGKLSIPILYCKTIIFINLFIFKGSSA